MQAQNKLQDCGIRLREEYFIHFCLSGTELLTITEPDVTKKLALLFF